MWGLAEADQAIGALASGKTNSGLYVRGALGRLGCCSTLCWALHYSQYSDAAPAHGVLSVSLPPVTLSKLRRVSNQLFVLQIYKAIYLLFLYFQNSDMKHTNIIALKMTEMNIKQYQKLYQQKKSSGQKVDSSTSVTVVLFFTKQRCHSCTFYDLE